MCLKTRQKCLIVLSAWMGEHVHKVSGLLFPAANFHKDRSYGHTRLVIHIDLFIFRAVRLFIGNLFSEICWCLWMSPHVSWYYPSHLGIRKAVFIVQDLVSLNRLQVRWHFHEHAGVAFLDHEDRSCCGVPGDAFKSFVFLIDGEILFNCIVPRHLGKAFSGNDLLRIDLYFDDLVILFFDCQ